MSDAIAAVGAWPALIVVLLVWGLAPGLVIRLIALSFRRADPRRSEMIAELYVVPRWEQPFWVLQQLERAFFEAMIERLAGFVRGRIINRWTLDSGVTLNRMHPDSFWIPDEEERVNVPIGAVVKLLFQPRLEHGERMWVEVTKRTRRGYVGKLRNLPYFVEGLEFGDKVRFRAEHIDIDAPMESACDCAECIGGPVEIAHHECCGRT